MSAVLERAIREPDVRTIGEYRRRVHLLALTYTALFLASLAGIFVVIWQAQFYVTLFQRSNAETLVLVFVLIFCAYLALLSVRGMWGALRVGWYAVLARLGRGGVELERRKVRALGPASDVSAIVGLNVALDLADHPCRPFRIPVADGAGSMGEIAVDGAEVAHIPSVRDGSNGLLAFFAEQVNDVLARREDCAHPWRTVQVVEWRRIDDERAEQYLNAVHFARRLGERLGEPDLWPRRTLTEDDVAEIARRFSVLCPTLRDEAFLPHWEYEGQHQLPLIPEPLGIISLQRTERRVDPLASMGCAVLIVAALVFAMLFLVAFPPWVPGK